MILLDQRQDQIDRRGHSGGGKQRAVADEDRVGFNARTGEPRQAFPQIVPVRRDTPPIDQSGVPDQEGAGADRAVAARGKGLLANPGQQRSVGRHGRAICTRNDEGIRDGERIMDRAIRPIRSSDAQRIGSSFSETTQTS